MARLVLTNAFISFASTNISQYVTSIGLSTSLTTVETTDFGATSKKFVAGLAENKLDLELNQDFAASALESLVFPFIGTSASMVVKPVDAATSLTNPAYSFLALVSEWVPLSGSIGSLAQISVSWLISGNITKTTA
jgi:hypothetical protein